MKNLLFFKTIILMFFCSSLFSQNGLTPLDSSMIACYPFSSNANDLSGNGNNGTVNGAVLVNDRFGNPNSAYSFNGTNQNIVVPNFNTKIIGNDVSISFWATASTYATRSALIMTPDDPANRFNVHVYYGNTLSNSQTFWDFGNISANGRLSDAPSPVPNGNTWDHWVFVSSATNGFRKYYKNGVLQLTLIGNSTFNNLPSKNLLIGGGLGVNSSFLWFGGSLDDIRIYTRVLIQNDVTKLYTTNPSCLPCPAISQATNITQPGNLLVCAGKSATLAATGNGTINWYNSPTSTVVIGTGGILQTSPLNAVGIYTFFATNSNSCATSPAVAINVTVNPTPTVLTSANPTLVCMGRSATITATGANSYSWNTGSILQSVVVFPTIGNSTYTVVGTNTSGCKASFVTQLSVKQCSDSPTGVKEKGKEILIDLYPNPNKGEFQINLGQIEENMNLEIYNSIGQQVYERKLNSYYNVINIKEQVKGIYFVKFTKGSVVLKQEKLIIE